MKKILTLVCAAAVLCAGCAGTPIDWSKARSMKAGMTEKELVEAMGQPNTVRAQGNSQTWVYVHVNGFSGATKTVSFVMKDGAVVEAPLIPDSFK